MQNKAYYLGGDGYAIGYCFAPTRGRARAIGAGQDPGDGAFTDIHASRVPSLDGREADFGGVAGGCAFYVDIYNPHIISILEQARLSLPALAVHILEPDNPWEIEYDGDIFFSKPHEHSYIDVAMASFEAHADRCETRVRVAVAKAFRGIPKTLYKNPRAFNGLSALCGPSVQQVLMTSVPSRSIKTTTRALMRIIKGTKP